MKIEKVLDVLQHGSYGAYVILKLLFKNRQSFVKVYSYVNQCLFICSIWIFEGLTNSLAWHTNVFRRFSFVFANTTYEPIRTILIDLCHDQEIQSVLMEDLFWSQLTELNRDMCWFEVEFINQ